MGDQGKTPAAVGTSEIGAELLALLCCPETRQGLEIAPEKLIARLEALRIAGLLRDRAGKRCDIAVTAGLVRKDGRLFFPIREGIPVLVADAALLLPPDET